ncbi:MAG: DUF3043 domain-containing protein [Bifidobacteriaceae bacterium]|nr:DUF3043 domain-containing protein [Bifidobacteriaceae bacterium]
MALFKKSKDAADVSPSAQAETKSKAAQTPGKGRPTPKRKDAQKANLHPLVPQDRKAAKKSAKARIREKEDREYEAMETGDVQHMPSSERIPWRIYVRDYVDARRNLGEWFMPIMFVALIASLILQNSYQVVAFWMLMIMYIYLIAVIIDAIVMWHGLKKKLIAKYGDKAVAKGQHTGMYAWSRALQIRSWRMPKPRYAKHGNWPE